MSARTRGIVLDALFGLLAVVAAGTTWWSIYQDLQLAVTVGVTAFAGTVLAAVAAARRWPVFVVALGTIVLFVALGVPLGVPTATTSSVLPTVDGLRELVLSSALGFTQLVTISLPVGTYQGLLVPVFELTLVASVVTVSIAARARPRRGDLAILPPLGLFAIGILLGSDLAILPRASAIVLLVVIVGWLVARHRGSRVSPIVSREDAGPGGRARTRRLRVQSVVSGVIILLTASAFGIAASLIAPPAGARQVVRTAIEQPFEPRSYTSPLAAYRSYLEDGESDAVLMELDGMPAGARVRLATLDTYDGVVYSVGSGDVDSASGYFARLPYRLDQSAVQGVDARIAVRIGAYSGVWVPTVGQLESIDFTGVGSTALDDAFYVNATTGTAADTATLATDNAYTMQTVVPTMATEDRAASLVPGSDQVPPLAVVPSELEVWLSTKTTGTSSPGQALAAMLQGLQDDGYFSDGLADDAVPSRSGHGADRITELFTDARMVGDSEQYAVAAAIMARSLGFPARVVMGFAPKVVEGETTVVTGADVRAWLEVDTAQSGWVGIDPTPTRIATPVDTTDPQSVSRPPTVVEPPLDEAPDTQSQTPPEASQNPAPGADPLVAVLILVGQIGGTTILVLAILLAPFITIIARKARRRRRRRTRGSPRERMRAGWSEFEDAVVDHGRPVVDGTTRREFAAAVAAPGALLLASVADRAAFSPEEPDDEEARRVWTGVDELRAALDRSTTRRGRWSARISTRSLRRRHRRRS